jgi:UDP-glucose 4-epimerase
VAGRMGKPTTTEHGPARPGDLRASALDCSKIGSALGWKPEVSLEDGIAGTVDWFLAQERSQAGTNL